MRIYFLFFSVLFLFSSCSHQKELSIKKNIVNNVDYPIFIQMPRNVVVFDNLSPILYGSLIDEFKRKGYKLSYNQKNSYILIIKIKNLFPVSKFISPDMLLYNTKIGLELHCKLFDVNNKLINEKSFLFSRLINKPKDPIMNTNFLDYQYKKIMIRASRKIETYIRRFLLK